MLNSFGLGWWSLGLKDSSSFSLWFTWPDREHLNVYEHNPLLEFSESRRSPRSDSLDLIWSRELCTIIALGFPVHMSCFRIKKKSIYLFCLTNLSLVYLQISDQSFLSSSPTWVVTKLIQVSHFSTFFLSMRNRSTLPGLLLFMNNLLITHKGPRSLNWASCFS